MLLSFRLGKQPCCHTNVSYLANETDWILNILKINYKLEQLHSVGAVYMLVKCKKNFHCRSLLVSISAVNLWMLFIWVKNRDGLLFFFVMLIPQSCTKHIKADWIQHLESLSQLKRLFLHINNTWDLGSANENLPVAHGMNFSIEHCPKKYYICRNEI